VQAYPAEQAVAAFKAISVPTLLVAGEVDQTGHSAGMRRVADMIHAPNSPSSQARATILAENPKIQPPPVRVSRPHLPAKA